MTMFDTLRLCDQMDLFQEALKLKNGRKRTNEENVILTIFDDIPRPYISIIRSPHFYISIRLEGWLVSNYMIDIRAAITIMPKAIIETMKLYITQCVDDVIQLDSSPMDIFWNVNTILIMINIFQDITLNQDIIIMDLPPLFGIYLSREFIAKLGGYLALDYTHLLLSHKNEYMKIPNEGIKFIHLMKFSKQNCMNASRLVETYDWNPMMESFLTTEILLVNDLNYQVTDVGMGNYYLYENTQLIFITTERDYEVWTMFFDGARCKH